MRWTVLLIVAFGLGIAAVLALMHRPVLWNAVEPGMSTDEVRRVLPQAVEPASPKRLANGLELKLVAAGVDNLERAFDAELYFAGDGVRQVVLLPTRLLTPAAAAAEFATLRHAATLRYGKEQPVAPEDGAAAQARWSAGPVRVTLRLERSGAMGRVTMTYATDEVAH
jgi:hypothetical protein